MQVRITAGPSVGSTGRAMTVSPGVYFIIFDNKSDDKSIPPGLYLAEEIVVINSTKDRRKRSKGEL
jgi:hypothetical protein